MECLQATEVLSMAHDGEIEDAALLAEARAHCAGCPSCTAFAATLDRMANLPAPEAPEHVIERLRVLGRKAASAREMAPAPAERLAETARARTSKEASVFAMAEHASRSRQRYAGFLTAAALLIVGTIVTAVSVGQMASDPASERATGLGTPESDVALGGDTLAAEQSTFADTSGPAYVLYEGAVYTLGDAPLPSTALVQRGTVTSALDGTGAPLTLPVLAASADTERVDSVWVERPDGTYLPFRQVVRTLRGRTFELVSEPVLTSFGIWPTLPSRFAMPQDANGGPTFAPAGFDDAGVDIYAPPGSDTANGFAVRPGTNAADPAAANPNWTWWEPLD